MAASTGGADSGGLRDLSTLYSKTGVSCLNEDEDHPHANALNVESDAVLRSDADEQLLFSIPFNAAVKLHAINIVADAESENRPTVVHVYVNRLNMGFDDAEDVKATQTLTLQPEDLGSNKHCKLNFVRFQNVDSVTLFFAENAGGDITEIAGLQMIGLPLEAMDLQNFKRVGPSE
eukprot:g3029.t1